MPIKVQCECGKAFSAKDELAGKTVKCPGCQKPLKIPGAAAPAASAAKPAAAKPAPAQPQGTKAKPQGAKPQQAKPAPAAKPAGGDGAHLFDEIGLQAAAEGTHPCPGCTEPMPIQAVVCIKCGYNTRMGRRMETVKMSGEAEGPAGHGAVAQGLLDRAAQVMNEDAAEEVKKTKEGMPWWVYLIFLLALIGLATYMLVGRGKKEEEGDKKTSLPHSTQVATA